jgi:hypothetical protein
MRHDAVGLFWDDTPPPRPIKAGGAKRVPPEPVWLKPDYLPGLEEAKRFPVDLFTDLDLVLAQQRGEALIVDVEVYKNYFLACFYGLDSHKVTYVEMHAGQQLDIRKLQYLMERFTTIGFNSIPYDVPMLALALAGCSTAEIKEASDRLIVMEERAGDILRSMRVKQLQVDHIDLIEVAPLRASLKTYAGRLHCRKMQDLPFHPSTILTEDQITITRWYCVNDITNTRDLRECLKEHLELRVNLSNEYKVDLRSKSDAQIAEAVIGAELTKRLGRRPQRPKIEPGTSYKYRIPHFMKFHTPLMNWALDIIRKANFVVDETGSIGMPSEIEALKLNIGNSTYTMGIGGLHSTESKVAHYANDNYDLIDKDVTSYYPFIILNLGLYPEHLGPAFLDVFRTIVMRRVAEKGLAQAAKKKGDLFAEASHQTIADSLKIVVNGSFGKLGSKWSILYAPNLLIQTTVTGQLSLLMLIERYELAGIHVVSANTDGIVMKCHKSLRGILDAITKQWEIDTGFTTEETEYSALYSRDVNNYVAVKKEDGKTKNKGAYANPWASKKNLADQLHKNPTNTICVEAVEAFLTKNVPIGKTIRECRDIRKFITVRSVKGGAVKVWNKTIPDHKTREELCELAGYHKWYGDSWKHKDKSDHSATTLERAYLAAQNELAVPGLCDYLGKSVRWYYGKNIPGELVYAKNGNKVPKSDGAVPLMELTEQFPDNIDYDRYEEDCYKMLEDIGAVLKAAA